MVHKFQKLEDYDEFDPVPYQGGYDQAARYGSLKPADKECAYRRSQSARSVETPVPAQYGNEPNPYARGHPGPPVFEGSPKPGAVYGGGRDRSQRSNGAAQPDKGVKTRNGSRKQASSNGKPPNIQADESSEYRHPRATYDYEVSEESGYRKLKSIYDEEDSGHPNSRPPFTLLPDLSPFTNSAYSYNDTESGFRQTFYGYGEAESGYRKPQSPYNDNQDSRRRIHSEVDQYGYRNLFYGYSYGAQPGRHNPQPTSYNTEDSTYRKPYNYGEQEAYAWSPAQDATSQSPTHEAYGRSSVTFSDEGGAYGGYGYGYGYGSHSNYGEEASTTASGYGYGAYGGYGGHWKKFAADDPAQFGGGSAFTEEPIQEMPAPAPGAARFWW